MNDFLWMPSQTLQINMDGKMNTCYIDKPKIGQRGTLINPRSLCSFSYISSQHVETITCILTQNWTNNQTLFNIKTYWNFQSEINLYLRYCTPSSLTILFLKNVSEDERRKEFLNLLDLDFYNHFFQTLILLDQ